MTLLTVDLMFHVLLTNWNLVTCCLLVWIYTVTVRHYCQSANGFTCHDM